VDFENVADNRDAPHRDRFQLLAAGIPREPQALNLRHQPQAQTVEDHALVRHSEAHFQQRRQGEEEPIRRPRKRRPHVHSLPCAQHGFAGHKVEWPGEEGFRECFAKLARQL
jgi:hypothetical protein